MTRHQSTPIRRPAIAPADTSSAKSLPAAGDCITLDNGLTFWPTSPNMRGAANYVISEIFTKRRYLRPGFEIGAADTVVDIGANMGLFVLWAAPQAPQGRVVAIEPTSVIECLEMNVARNGLTNVTPIRAAVGRDGDEFELLTYPGFNIVTHRVGWQPKWVTRFLIGLLYGKYRQTPVRETARAVSLGTIMDQQRLQTIDYLKCDCEGGEYEIFRGLASDTLRRVRCIALEFHELDPSQKHQELVDILQCAGFQVEVHKPPLEYYFMRYGMMWARRE